MPDLSEEYIEFLCTAESIVQADNSPELFIRSLFPEATNEQIATFRLYTIGKMHDGIVQGLVIAGRNPIGEVEAYQIGVNEGLSRKNEHTD